MAYYYAVYLVALNFQSALMMEGQVKIDASRRGILTGRWRKASKVSVRPGPVMNLIF